MKTLAPPALPALAALAELTARLARAADLSAIATTLASATKWIVPVDKVLLFARLADGALAAWPAGTPHDASGGLATTLLRNTTTRSVTTAEAGVSGVAPDGLAWLVIPLADGDSTFGALALGVRTLATLDTIDSGICHLLALNVASSVRSALLLRREHQATESARQAIHSRDLMMAAITHDLRSPLGAAMGFVELLADGTDATWDQDLGDLGAALTNMKGLVDELLDVATIQAAGGLRLHRSHGEVNDVVRAAVAAHRADLRTGYRLDLALVDAHLEGDIDEARLQRVFSNLIGNAIKYSPQGGAIAVSSSRDERGGKPWAIVRVTDSGIGIPETDLPKLFGQFKRMSNVGKIRGTGVGLHTSREIAVRHGGDIRVSSTVGVGSTFSVEIPLLA